LISELHLDLLLLAVDDKMSKNYNDMIFKATSLYHPLEKENKE